MASFCVRPNGIVQYDLCLYGRRFRESSGLRDTPVYTGLRTCEVNGLKVRHLDLERRQLRIREARVDGRQTTVKHRKTRRDIPLSPTLAEELERHIGGKGSDDYVFTRVDGRPLDPSWVAEQLWKPTLKALGLAPRRVYQTRHTAAVLHLAAGENPLFVSRLLGHASTKMLYERYAPFVANALADDGSAFEAMMAGCAGKGRE